MELPWETNHKMAQMLVVLNGKLKGPLAGGSVFTGGPRISAVEGSRDDESRDLKLKPGQPRPGEPC
jgi:hypothetical protein